MPFPYLVQRLCYEGGVLEVLGVDKSRGMTMAKTKIIKDLSYLGLPRRPHVATIIP